MERPAPPENIVVLWLAIGLLVAFGVVTVAGIVQAGVGGGTCSYKLHVATASMALAVHRIGPDNQDEGARDAARALQVGLGESGLECRWIEGAAPPEFACR